MAKHQLDLEYDYDFLMLGISCHAKDYRLCWTLNNLLNINLVKVSDLMMTEKEDAVGYSLYEFHEESTYSDFLVVSNHGKGGTLIPELKTTDYFLIIKGPAWEDRPEELTSSIKEIKIVNTAFLINPADLKSKENLMF